MGRESILKVVHKGAKDLRTQFWRQYTYFLLHTLCAAVKRASISRLRSRREQK